MKLKMESNNFPLNFFCFNFKVSVVEKETKRKKKKNQMFQLVQNHRCTATADGIILAHRPRGPFLRLHVTVSPVNPLNTQPRISKHARGAQ